MAYLTVSVVGNMQYILRGYVFRYKPTYLTFHSVRTINVCAKFNGDPSIDTFQSGEETKMEPRCWHG